MALRIFIQFRTDRVPGEPARKPLTVAAAACSKLLGRDFDFQKDFLHAQGEISNENARCHVLVDCNYHDFEPDMRNVTLHSYRVIEGNTALTLDEITVHRGRINTIPWGRHSF